MERITNQLRTNKEYLSRLLGWPESLGIQLRDLTLGSGEPRAALLIWVNGVADAQAISQQLLPPLLQLGGQPTWDALQRAIPTHELRRVSQMRELVEAVLAGQVGLLVDGRAEALLLAPAALEQQHGGSAGVAPADERFGRELRQNVAQLRRRLPVPNLRAVSVAERAGDEVVLVYVQGKAYPPLVRLVRQWACRHAGQNVASEGRMTGAAAVRGGLPRFTVSHSPDQAVKLLRAGYVLLLVNRVPSAYLAPVTAATAFTAPSGNALTYPARVPLARVRLTFYLVVLLLPGVVVALLNYHQEMIPTGFMMAVASTRENAPFGVFFEVLVLEAVVEVSRAAAFRHPKGIPLGTALVGVVLLLLLATLTGFVGPLPALAAGAGALISLALPGFGGTYLVRIWRFYLLVAAVILGFFGMATALALLLVYLCQARSWGVPFLGPSGWDQSSPESPASHPPRFHRRERRDPKHTALR